MPIITSYQYNKRVSDFNNISVFDIEDHYLAYLPIALNGKNYKISIESLVNYTTYSHRDIFEQIDGLHKDVNNNLKSINEINSILTNHGFQLVNIEETLTSYGSLLDEHTSYLNSYNTLLNEHTSYLNSYNTRITNNELLLNSYNTRINDLGKRITDKTKLWADYQ